MLKTYTLKKRVEEKLTDTKGSIEFHLVDEFGETRVITGTTYLVDGVAQGVSSKNKRELPLIEGIFRLDLEEETEIEFDLFNEVYDRATDKTVNQVAHDLIMNSAQKKKNIMQRMKSLFSSKAKKIGDPSTS